jgi:hypothetical protein
MDEQALVAKAIADYRDALAQDKARKKYHLRLIRHAGWCYHPLSKAHWLITGPGMVVDKERGLGNRHARRAAAARTRHVR